MKSRYHERTFQLWDYKVGHQRMLIRSPKSPTNPKNIDVKFYGVSYVDVPAILRGVEFDDPTEAEISNVISRAGELPVRERRLFVLVSGNKRFLVVAAEMKVDETELDWSESPFTNSDG